MSQRSRPIVLAVALLGLGFGPAREARAGFYTFTGTVTSVDDPFGAFSSLGALGVSVRGSFAYDDAASYISSSFFPSETTYLNFRRERPQVTGLELNIGGAIMRSDPTSLTNLAVGDDVPAGASIFPAGDYFRYFETLAYQPASGVGLVDYSRFSDESFAVPFASLLLSDPTGRAFSSQDLPRGALPLSAFTGLSGQFSFYDGNGEDINYGSIGFRIDSIQSVPEPGSLILMACAGGIGTVGWVWRGRGRGRPAA